MRRQREGPQGDFGITRIVLDDAGRAFTIRLEKPERRTITTPYDDFLRVIEELAVSTRTEPGATEPRRHYWFYFERKPGAYPERFVLDMGKEGADLLAKMRPFLGDRLRETDFPLAEELAGLLALRPRRQLLRPCPAPRSTAAGCFQGQGSGCGGLPGCGRRPEAAHQFRRQWPRHSRE